jgi:transcriptional regulator with XRE-family HTH domain
MPAWVTSSIHEKAVAALVQARREAGLTQRDLAARTGKHQSFIAKIERCERNLSLLEFVGLAAAIGVRPDVLLRRITEDLPSPLEF